MRGGAGGPDGSPAMVCTKRAVAFPAADKNRKHRRRIVNIRHNARRRRSLRSSPPSCLGGERKRDAYYHCARALCNACCQSSGDRIDKSPSRWEIETPAVCPAIFSHAIILSLSLFLFLLRQRRCTRKGKAAAILSESSVRVFDGAALAAREEVSQRVMKFSC